jgi:hypothetical protein
LRCGRARRGLKGSALMEGEDGTQTCDGESEGRTTMVGQGEDGVDVSAGGIVQEKRVDDCAGAGVEEGVAERAELGDADADVLYQPRGTQPERVTARRIEPGKEAAFGADKASLALEKEGALKSHDMESSPIKKATLRRACNFLSG